MIQQSVVLKSVPQGLPEPSDFALVEAPAPLPGPGEVLTRTIWLSLDPYMRGRISGRKSYAKGVDLGEVMTGETVGEVLASNHPDFAPGDIALGPQGWQTHIISPAARVVKLPRDAAPLSTYLGVLGMPGTTAYSGMLDIGQPKAGETVVISAASGAVGSVAGQLAMRAGARAVGIAGGAEKCRYVREQLGFDGCIDYRAGDLEAELDRLCPGGIDVYFENVGGAVQRAVYPRLNDFGRMVMCGLVAEYNLNHLEPGPNLRNVIVKRLRIEGLIVTDKVERFAEWRALASPWVMEGTLRYLEDVVEGLDRAAEAFIGLFEGRNFGKLLVRVGPDAI